MRLLLVTTWFAKRWIVANEDKIIAGIIVFAFLYMVFQIVRYLV